MQTVKTYEEWLELSDTAREKEYLNWNTFAGEGREILDCAVKELKSTFTCEDDAVKISGILYHVGVWAISADINRTTKIKLPKRFSGFPIMKSINK